MPLKDPAARAQYKKEWLEERSRKHKEYHRETHLKKRYGISLEQFNEMQEQQRNRCAICGKGPDDHQKYLHVDHCHTTGKVRGLLCGNCNRAIGLMKESIEQLKAAVEYLEEHADDPSPSIN